MAGTRIDTDLRGLAGSISVVTKDFMADLGATSAEDLLVYTLGTEIGGPQGNFAGAEVGGRHVEFTGAIRDPQSANRVRGLAAADFTRNFYLTSIRFDSYNIQRVDINRGSNAILFGLGSPSGIINNQLLQPTFRRKASVALEYGSFGSGRFVLDVDQTLGRGQAGRAFCLGRSAEAASSRIRPSRTRSGTSPRSRPAPSEKPRCARVTKSERSKPTDPALILPATR